MSRRGFAARVFRRYFRWVGLPLDILRLTFDYLRLTAGWIANLVWASVGAGSRQVRLCPTCPRDETSAARARFRCRRSLDYACPLVLGLLCPRLVLRRAAGLAGRDCNRNPRVRIGAFRYLAVGVALGVFWAAAAVAGWRGAKLPAHTRTQAPSAEIGRARRLAGQKDFARARIAFLNAVKSEPASAAAHFGLAECCLALGLAEEAKAGFEKVVQLNPAAGPAHLALARLAYDRGDTAEGLGHAERARTLLPQSPDAHLLVGIGRQRLGESKPALESLRQATALAPANAQLLGRAGDLALSMGQVDEAEACFKRAQESDPDGVAVRMGLARVAKARRSYDRAIEMLRSVITSEAGRDTATSEMADIYLETGRLPDAIELYRDLALRRPDMLNARERLAELYLRTGNMDEGERTASRLLADHPRSVPAHLILAEIFLRKGLPSLSIEHCQRGLALGGRIAKARKLLAEAYRQKGAMSEAVRELESLLDDEPDDLDARLSLAQCYEKLGRAAAAVKCLEAACQAHPQAAQPHVQLGLVYQVQNDADRAMARYRAALQRDPNQPMALNNLAALLLDGDGAKSAVVDEAFDLATRAQRLMPGHPAVADTLGWALFHRRDLQSALGYLGYAAIRSPEVPTVHYHLAAALFAAGRLDAAEGELKLALSKRPTEPQAERARGLLAEIQKRKPAPAEGTR